MKSLQSNPEFFVERKEVAFSITVKCITGFHCTRQHGSKYLTMNNVHHPNI